MATKDNTTNLSDFLLDVYTGITNAYCAGAGLPQPFELKTVAAPMRRNYENRCIALYDTFERPCGKPTVACPACGEDTDLCEDCLIAQPDGTRVCPECDGSPRFNPTDLYPQPSTYERARQILDEHADILTAAFTLPEGR